MADPVRGLSERERPANVQAEQSLLGAILHDNRTLDRCEGLRPEHFHDRVNGRIFEVIRRLAAEGRTVDAVVLRSVLENSGVLEEVGGTRYLTQLLAAMVSILTAGEYARVIRDAWLRREAIDAAEDMVNAAFGADPAVDGEGVITGAVERLLALGEAATAVDAGDFSDALDDALDAADAAHRGSGVQGLMTGVSCLDDLWRGMYPGSLDILAARSEHGKTALGMQIAEEVGRVLLAEGRGEHVHIVSGEMTRRDLSVRMLAGATGIPADDIRSGRIGEARGELLIRARADLRQLPLVVHDKRGMTLGDICMAARVARRRRKTRLLVIDHLHRIRPDKHMLRWSRAEQVQAISEGLKNLAGDLDIPILLLAQLSRENERREGADGARPRVADIQYAGERDGDNIILLWRPELHMGAAPPTLPDRLSAEKRAEADAAWWLRRDAMRGKAEAIFAKRRFGPTGSTWLAFDGVRTRFGNPRDTTTDDLWRHAQADDGCAV